MSNNNAREYDILDEYVDVTNKIREIQEILNRYKKETHDRIERAKSDSKKERIVLEFQKKMREIRKSSLITTRYKKLKRRQAEIRDILLPDESDTESDFDSNSSAFDSNIHSDSDTLRNGSDILSLLDEMRARIS